MKIPPHHHNERASPLDASILGCAVSVILYVLSNQKSMFHPDLARLPQNFCAKHESSRKRLSHKNRSSIFSIINTYFFLLCDLGYKIFKQNMIKYEVSTGNTKRPPRHLSPPLIIPLWERFPAFLFVRQNPYIPFLKPQVFPTCEHPFPGKRADHPVGSFSVRIYPSATSSIIMSVKPTANESTPMFECSPSLISGISSSTTT